MKLIDRFISRELMVNLLFAIGVLSLVLVIGNIFRKLLPLLVNHDVPVEFLLTFIAYVLPFFGRLSADNELVALRSNGVSIARICVPIAVVAVICTAVSLWLNVQVAPAAQLEVRRTIFDLATRNPMALFGSDQIIDQFPGRKIYVGKKDGNELENIIVFETNEDSMPMRVTYAKRGTLEADLPNQQILMHLFGARYQQRDEEHPGDLTRVRDGINMAEGTLPISLQELYQKEQHRTGRSALSIEQLIEQLKTGDRSSQSSTRTEISKRFSFPFSCLAFALVAVPLGVTAHRRETSMGFLISLVVAFSYFIFIIMADTLRGNAGLHPELLVWVPNVLFLVVGAWFFRRLARQ